MLKNKIKQSEEIKQSSELDSGMSQMMELEGRQFQMTMINRLKALMEKVDNMQ